MISSSAAIKLSRVCPVCNNNKAFLLGDIKYAIYDNYPVRNDVKLVSCNKCGMVFYETPSTEYDYNEYYKKHNYYYTTKSQGMGGETSKDQNRFLSYIKLIEKYDIPDSKISVDIGCAKGGLLRTLKEKGYTNLCGVDSLDANINRLQETAVADVRTGTATDVPLPDVSCGMAFLTHTIEHVFNLKKAMSELFRILDADGIAYIEIPDAASYPTYRDAPLYDFFHEHINYFDKPALKNLVNINGFECLEVGNKSFDGHDQAEEECLYCIVKKNGSMHKIRPSFLLSEKWHGNLFKTPGPIKQFLENYDSARPVYIWGLSSYMLYLLASYLLPRCNIAGLHDSDEYKQTRTIRNYKINSPEIMFQLDKSAIIVIPTGPYSSKLKSLLFEGNFKGDVYLL
ncbi:MAG: class I SAM-dependent methyltransferase [Proteobacteria bacterium]|nr:class I SAM-dependent methyltransferase [Pseudomonadota bacterium]